MEHGIFIYLDLKARLELKIEEYFQIVPAKGKFLTIKEFVFSFIIIVVGYLLAFMAFIGEILCSIRLCVKNNK